MSKLNSTMSYRSMTFHQYMQQGEKEHVSSADNTNPGMAHDTAEHVELTPISAASSGSYATH